MRLDRVFPFAHGRFQAYRNQVPPPNPHHAETASQAKFSPRLLNWARAAARRSAPLPPLWLFTDYRRLRDPRPAIARLPRGLAGVVFRHDEDPDRAALGQAVAQICRDRRLVLVVAGDTRLAAALHAGCHLREGRRSGHVALRRGPITSSAHRAADIVRARLAGANLVFLSPVFPTASHPDARTLGALRWSRLAACAGVPMAALGGIDGRSAYRLPRRYCHALGAIGAMSADKPVA
jgi:thiamine-phosphate pyrophosphorylase